MIGEWLGPAFGAGCALGSAVSWTLISLVVRTLSAYFSTLSINVIRSALGGVALAAVVLIWKGPTVLRTVTPESYWYLAVSILIAVGIGDTAFFESTKLIGLSRAMTVSMVYPLMAAGLGSWLLEEPVTARGTAGALVTLGGLVIIVSERAPAVAGVPDQRIRGVGLAVVAAVAWAVSVLMLKTPLREVDPVTAQAIRLPVATAILWLTPWGWGTGRLAFREQVTWQAVAGAVLSVAGIALLTV